MHWLFPVHSTIVMVAVGIPVGSIVGLAVGPSVGALVGLAVGPSVGLGVAIVGLADGTEVGGEGANDGEAVRS